MDHLVTLQLLLVTEQGQGHGSYHVPFKVKTVNQNANYYSMTKHFKAKWVVV